jgi:hypothetical protein
LIDVEAAGHADIIRGGTQEAELLHLTIEAVRERISAEVDVDSGVAHLRDPTAFEPGVVWYHAWGRGRAS